MTQQAYCSSADKQSILLSKSVLVLIFGAIAIGFSPILVRLSELGPTATAFYRVFLALPVLLLLKSSPVSEKTDAKSLANTYGLLCLAGFLFATDLSLWHFSINYTNIANATLLANVSCIFVTAGAWILYREPIGKNFIIGLITALSGAAFIVGENVIFEPELFLGDLMALSAAAFYGGYLLVIKKLCARCSTKKIMLFTSISSAALLLPLSILLGESLIALTMFGWLMLVLLAIVAQGIGQSMVTYAMAQLPASFSSVALLLQPLVAALVAWYLFAESLTVTQAIGGCLVLFGIYYCRRSQEK